MGKNDDMRAYYLFGLRIMADFGATIAIPAVVAAVAGMKLDQAWQSRPYALIACLLLAFGLTALVVRRKAAAYGEEYRRLINQPPDSPPKADPPPAGARGDKKPS